VLEGGGFVTERALRRSSPQDAFSGELLDSVPWRSADDMNRKRHLAVDFCALQVKTSVILCLPQGLPTLLQAGRCMLILLGGNSARRQRHVPLPLADRVCCDCGGVGIAYC
jgi:hypothetical protein